MADRVEEGLPIQDVMEFGKQAGFTTDELAKLIHIPPRTYARRVAAHARLKIPEGERLRTRVTTFSVSPIGWHPTCPTKAC